MELVTPYLKNPTIVMGVQTGSDQMLKKMNRGHTRAQAINAISLLREYGFMPHVDFIVGNPDETFEEQFALVDFMEEMIDKYKIKVELPNDEIINLDGESTNSGNFDFEVLNKEVEIFVKG